jgi:hypothetical protein
LYQAAVDVEPVWGECEPRGRDLSAGERGLLEACVPAPRVVCHRRLGGSAPPGRRIPEPALRHRPTPAEAVALDLADRRSQQRVLLRDLDLRVSEPGVYQELLARVRSSRSTGSSTPTESRVDGEPVRFASKTPRRSDLTTH